MWDDHPEGAKSFQTSVAQILFVHGLSRQTGDVNLQSDVVPPGQMQQVLEGQAVNGYTPGEQSDPVCTSLTGAIPCLF